MFAASIRCAGPWNYFLPKEDSRLFFFGYLNAFPILRCLAKESSIPLRPALESLQFVGFKDKPLGYAAKRHFGSRLAAVTAAGLESRAPALLVTRTWSPVAVLAAIRLQGIVAKPVAPIWKDDTGLYSVAKKHFGSWRNAVIAAGLQPAHRRWTKELVIQEINARKTQGLSLSSGHRDRDIRLIAAALRYFGGWGAAKAAAEFEAIDQSSTPARNQEERATACREKT